MEKYSFSKVKNFLNCPLSFYKRYFEKPEKDRPELAENHGTSEFGSFVHEILESYEKGELETYEMLPFYKKHYDEKVTGDFTLRMTETYYKNFAQDYYDSGERYLENFDGFNDFHVLEAEYEFEISINDLFIFTGKVDLIAEDENGDLIVIDHKSKSRFKTRKEKAEYAMQLYLYSYAVYQKYNRFPKTLMFNMFRRGNWEKIEFKEEEFQHAIDWITERVIEIESTFEFPPGNDLFYCWNFCPYRHAYFEECKRE